MEERIIVLRREDLRLQHKLPWLKRVRWLPLSGDVFQDTFHQLRTKQEQGKDNDWTEKGQKKGSGRTAKGRKTNREKTDRPENRQIKDGGNTERGRRRGREGMEKIRDNEATSRGRGFAREGLPMHILYRSGRTRQTTRFIGAQGGRGNQQN